MSERIIHIVQILIRQEHEGRVAFLFYPHEGWKADGGKYHWALPTKTTVDERPEPFEQGTSLEAFVDTVMQQKLGLAGTRYALEQELEVATVDMPSLTRELLTHYLIYPVDVWVEPTARGEIRTRLSGVWWTPEEALAQPELSPTARKVFELVLRRERQIEEHCRQDPAAERQPEAPRRLLAAVPDRPTMDAWAKKWFRQNRGGVRVLPRQTLDRILDLGDRAFNLRVADPYLRYQQQGVGFTWSFFTHKDRQDTHVHGAPVVEIYGVLEGRLEIWWKPYYDRGTSLLYEYPKEWQRVVQALTCARE